MGTKMALSFANIFMAEIETTLIQQSETKPKEWRRYNRRNISKTSASVSSGFPNTRKLMKARGRRPSAFIVFECLETPMKHEARVFEIASQTCIMNQELVTDRMRCLNMRRLVK